MRAGVLRPNEAPDLPSASGGVSRAGYGFCALGSPLHNMLHSGT